MMGTLAARLAALERTRRPRSGLDADVDPTGELSRLSDTQLQAIVDAEGAFTAHYATHGDVDAAVRAAEAALAERLWLRA